METLYSGSTPSSAGTSQTFDVSVTHPSALSEEGVHGHDHATIVCLNCPRLIRQDPCKHAALRFTFPTGIDGASSAPPTTSRESRLTDMPMDATIRHLQLGLNKQAERTGLGGGQVHILRTDTYWAVGVGSGEHQTCGASNTGLYHSLYWTQGDDLGLWSRQLVPLRIDRTALHPSVPDFAVMGVFDAYRWEINGISAWMGSERDREQDIGGQVDQMSDSFFVKAMEGYVEDVRARSGGETVYDE